MKKYGWKPDLPDHRDRLYKISAPIKLPSSVDMRPSMPLVYDQGQLGSCTANAIAAALEFERMKQSLPPFTPSRLFIYYNERVMENDVGQDNGAQIRDGIKSVGTMGAPPETEWPYVEALFAAEPPPGDYTDALSNRALQYRRLDNTRITELKAALVSGSPFVFGFTVYEAFESEAVAASGNLDLPNENDPPLGGHAVLCVGYDDVSGGGEFIVRNSWGVSWGRGGYFTIPYAYLTNPNMADDFWVISLVGQ